MTVGVHPLAGFDKLLHYRVPDAMQEIAAGSGGKSFSAVSGSELNSVYDQIRKSVGYDTVPRDMTDWFLGLGLVMLILTSGAALVWNQRLP